MPFTPLHCLHLHLRSVIVGHAHAKREEEEGRQSRKGQARPALPLSAHLGEHPQPEPPSRTRRTAPPQVPRPQGLRTGLHHLQHPHLLQILQRRAPLEGNNTSSDMLLLVQMDTYRSASSALSHLTSPLLCSEHLNTLPSPLL